jgi:hypothetical protein
VITLRTTGAAHYGLDTPWAALTILACQPIDLRNGFDGLAAKVRGQLFRFRGKRGDYLKWLRGDRSSK